MSEMVTWHWPNYIIDLPEDFECKCLHDCQYQFTLFCYVPHAST